VHLKIGWRTPTDSWLFWALAITFDYRDFGPQETLHVLAYIMQSIPPERKRPFGRTSEKEICKENKVFILRIIKIDPQGRPSAAALLQDNIE
jgi:hypothetical protein